MFYYGYHFWGMHLIWWFFWILIIVVLFGWFEPVPKRRIRSVSPLGILQKRFASGEITKEEYEERKSMIKKDQ